MVKQMILGDITAQDDYTHPRGPESNFNESMYFNLFDRAPKASAHAAIANVASAAAAKTPARTDIQRSRNVQAHALPLNERAARTASSSAAT